VPRTVRERWRHYAGRVRLLCVEAIRQRPGHRTYIRWLETRIAELPPIELDPPSSEVLREERGRS